MAIESPAALTARPASPKVFGILSVVFGGLILLFSLAALASSGAFNQMGGFAMNANLEDEIAALAAMSMYQPILWSAMSAWLIAIGIGQLMYRRWAATQAVAWGIIGIICCVALVVFSIIVTAPLVEKLSEAAGLGFGFGVELMGSGAIIGAAVYLPYPILQLVFFRKPAIVQSMT